MIRVVEVGGGVLEVVSVVIVVVVFVVVETELVGVEVIVVAVLSSMMALRSRLEANIVRGVLMAELNIMRKTSTIL